MARRSPEEPLRDVSVPTGGWHVEEGAVEDWPLLVNVADSGVTPTLSLPESGRFDSNAVELYRQYATSDVNR